MSKAIVIPPKPTPIASDDLAPLVDATDSVVRLTIGSKFEQKPITDVAILKTHLENASSSYGLVNLQELILWRVSGLKEIPPISQLTTLDIRRAHDLKRISVPAGIKRLIVEDCPNLDTIEIVFDELDQLWDISLSGCKLIPAQTITRLLRKSPNLTKLDLSGIPTIEELTDSLGNKLERIDLSNCDRLSSLRGRPRLEHVDLRGCSSLNKIEWGDTGYLKYVDLSLCRKLRSIAGIEKRVQDGSLQSLLLFGSGVLDPPSSEHGEQLGDDVAKETADFFNDKELSGKGRANRCKLLLLGNGAAGKTELAHRLCDLQRVDHRSTDNIQFWTVDDFLLHGDTRTDLHIWDFGGQEIYHSTHRLFVSAGSIFFIVWDPSEKLSVDEGRYSIRYWLDYIYSVAPGFNPLVAIVCNDKRASSGALRHVGSSEWLERSLKAQLSRQVGAKYFEDITTGRIGLFCSDLRNDHSVHSKQSSHDGDWQKIKDWVKESISELYRVEGSEIPRFWQYGQELVKPKLPNAIPTRVIINKDRQTKRTPTIAFVDFQKELSELIENKISSGAGELDTLRRNWDRGKFLCQERTRRVLRYLTRTGYLYWDSKLHNEEVIIDQAWALETVYRVLERDKGDGTPTLIRDALRKLGGAFDEDFLDSQVLRDGLGGGGSGPLMNRSLLLSFMLSTGVCFPLLRPWETSQSKRQTYLSPNHLPMSDEEVQGIRESEFAGASEELVLESPMIHQGHWHALMRLVAQQHGGEATIYRRAIRIAGHYYSQDAASGQSRKDFACLVECKPVGYGKAGEIESEGKILFRSIGLDESNRLKLRKLLESPLPGFMGNATAVISEYQPMAKKRPEEPTIFFSYAWDYEVPKDEDQSQEEVRIEYSKFVDQLEKMVNEDFPGLAQVVRDKNENRRGDSIPDFMSRIKTCKYALVVLSDKYFKSWYCMYELRELFVSLIADNRGRSRVQFIIHPSVPTLDKDDEFWTNMVSVWEERLNFLKEKRRIQTTGERGSNSKPTGLILDEELEKACQVELGMNSLDRWWELPMHFMSKILEIPKEAQMLEMHKKLIYEKEKHGKLTAESIDECIEATIEWLQLREKG